MPQRKKKGKEMPPLQFVQSPMEQDIPAAYSGNFETACPLLAKAISVDKLESFHWVSPHFKNRPTTQALRSRKTVKNFTKLRSKSEGSLIDCYNSDIKSKFPPLQFVEQSPKFSHGKCYGQGVTSNQRRNASFSETQSTDMHGSYDLLLNHNKKSSESFQEENRKNLNRKDKNNKICVFQGSENSLLGADINEINTVLQASTPACITESEAGNSSATEAETGGERCRKCGILSDELYATGQNEASGIVFTLCVHCRSGNNVLHHSTPIVDSERNKFPSPLTFCTPPSRSSVKILAADTPECDYGLSMRQRQLKYFSNCSNNVDNR